MFATQAALGALPRDVLAEIDSFRRRRVRRARTARDRHRKAAVVGEDLSIPFPMAWDIVDGEFRYAAYYRELFARFQALGY
jgi:hypothetical protein